ncbi:cell division protein FtsL [Lactobacillus bombicola]|uniref:Cell division protein FtsL n=1 Tax=Lactobacillus bombicola TaxID=1505723 RepID=A0A1I1QZ88_9LACO|nr:cell division protein FtsL [Lactobacillus bombicola]MCO6528303.1 cell division protein FtsL [Lactobacillus sp.]SFD27436.1 cell division protein FtsL [Lactobacillus bombicola]
MADNLAREIEYDPKEELESKQQQHQSITQQYVPWSGFEKIILFLGTIITISMMTILVSASITVTSAQHELTNIQRSVDRGKSEVSDLHQELGELTSSSRINRIARSQGLILIDKNIRTIH